MDHVGEIVETWRTLRPDLELAPMLVVGRIHRLARIMDRALRPTFAGAGLAPGDFDILAALYRGRPTQSWTAGDLHRALMVTTGAITKQVDRLAAKGLVRRDASPEDARVRRVTLTHAGARLVDELIDTHLATERELIAALDSDQRDCLTAALAVLTAALEGRG